MQVSEKLLILADSAKYDVSCASSGVGRRDARYGQLYLFDAVTGEL